MKTLLLAMTMLTMPTGCHTYRLGTVRVYQIGMSSDETACAVFDSRDLEHPLVIWTPVRGECRAGDAPPPYNRLRER